MGLQRSDRPHGVVQSLLHFTNLLPGPVLVERAGLGRGLALLAHLIQHQAVLSDPTLIALDHFVNSYLATGKLAQRLTELIDLPLQGALARDFPLPVVFLTMLRDSTRNRRHACLVYCQRLRLPDCANRGNERADRLMNYTALISSPSSVRIVAATLRASARGS
jgi:hypothetical protein